MIKPYELNAATRCLLDALSEDEVERVLEMATDLKMAMDLRPVCARLGENSAVELVIRTILFFETHPEMVVIPERGTSHE